MELLLRRTEHTPSWVVGTLYRFDASSDSAQAMLRIVENPAFMIPSGRYRVRVTDSPRFRRPLPLVEGVVGRSGIRFHAGTLPEQSRGCLLVGSRAQEKWLTELLSACRTNTLTIVNA